MCRGFDITFCHTVNPFVDYRRIQGETISIGEASNTLEAPIGIPIVFGSTSFTQSSFLIDDLFPHGKERRCLASTCQGHLDSFQSKYAALTNSRYNVYHTCKDFLKSHLSLKGCFKSYPFFAVALRPRKLIQIFVRTFLAKSVVIPRIIYCEPDAQRKQFAVFTIGMSLVKTHGNGA